MANQNDTMPTSVAVSDETVDLDALEARLRAELDENLEELTVLQRDREKIGNPSSLVETVQSVVWEQFLNQLASTAGEDFIRENKGLTLDLSKDAHIQTTENFAEGKIAQHNTEISYQDRYDDWQSSFQRDSDGQVRTQYDHRSQSERPVITKDARKPFDKRDKGSASMHKDHTIAAAEIIRDPEANAHLSKEQRVQFANGDTNLKDLQASANESKGDSSMEEWLASDRHGEKPAERYGLDEAELQERDKKARSEYDKLKKEGERKSVETGKVSRKEEALRAGGTAIRAALMQLLADLIKEVMGKFVLWLKQAKKDVGTLIEHLKSAISSFVGKLKQHLINAATSVMTAVTTAILGPVVRTISRVFTILKQGWKSLKEAIDYLKNPENRNKPFSILMLEVGKIVVAGLTAVGTLLLGEVIEKALMTIPVFAIEIPLLGSLASIVGLFLGGLVAGIVGALAISLIDKTIATKRINDAVLKEVASGNKVMEVQVEILNVDRAKLSRQKTVMGDSIRERHRNASESMAEMLDDIRSETVQEKDSGQNSRDLDELLGK